MPLFALVIALAVAPGSSEPAGRVDPKVVEGTLSRSRVRAVLDRGPQRFIASLRVEPYLDGGRFVGFRIVRYQPSSPMVNSTSIVPGDVILSVNQESVERPEQFMRAWELVKGASALEIGVLRGTQRLLYRWTLTP